MKKVVCILVLTCIIAGAAFAQAKKPAAKAQPKVIHNWISGEAGLIEAGVRYEYMINKSFGVGFTAFWNSLIFWNSLGVQLAARLFPAANIFYVELGLGYGYVQGWEDVSEYGYSWSWPYIVKGLMVTPGIGWKIDFGKPGGFFINPMLGVPLVFGKRTYDAWNWTGKSEFKIGINVKAACGFGFAF